MSSVTMQTESNINEGQIFFDEIFNLISNDLDFQNKVSEHIKNNQDIIKAIDLFVMNNIDIDEQKIHVIGESLKNKNICKPILSGPFINYDLIAQDGELKKEIVDNSWNVIDVLMLPVKATSFVLITIPVFMFVKIPMYAALGYASKKAVEAFPTVAFTFINKINEEINSMSDEAYKEFVTKIRETKPIIKDVPKTTFHFRIEPTKKQYYFF